MKLEFLIKVILVWIRGLIVGLFHLRLLQGVVRESLIMLLMRNHWLDLQNKNKRIGINQCLDLDEAIFEL